MAYRSNGDYPSDDGDSREPQGERENSIIGEDNDKPTYLMEHLATFTVAKETGIVYPADGMRRLLQLEKTNGIWSQKMQLCLDRSWVLIMDFETGTVMERFPASMIQEPTAFTSHDPMEIYNNILVFIVGGNGSGSGYNLRSEMHIFQCQSISAQDLVEDLKELSAGKMITRNRNSSRVPTPPVKRSHQSPSPSHERQTGNFTNYRESDLELSAINDDASSTTSEKYERDVTILNHCFDDIEKFIARLQHVAAASRELERRRRNRKSKKRDLGDGILTMRTKPPPERDFIDIFQKFKLSFNLLAKLKAHIHDPNAPELVHFLFTPLALIVDASHETYYDPNLPSKVVSPLLTREAVNLLINCVTSKETELWHSLGNAWLVPRDQWKGHVPSYHPVFMDGWSPDFPIIDEQDPMLFTGKTGRDSHGDTNYSSDYFGYEQPLNELRMQDLSARSDISLDSIERNGGEDRGPPEQSQEAWLEELQSRGANVVQVTYPRTANNDKELTVVRGEYLEVLDNSRKWWKARNIDGKIAHVPHTIVTPHVFGNNSSNNDPSEIFNNPLYTRNVNRNVHRQDSVSGRYSAGNSSEHQPSTAPADWVRKEHLGKKVDGGNSTVPPPPPPPPLVIPFNETNTDTLRSTKSTTSTATAKSYNPQDDVNDELKAVLSFFRQNRRDLAIVKTPEVYIRQTSSPEEVQQWLKAKGFSDQICNKLKELTGYDLFSIEKSTLELYCGSSEGKRLASQITIQKNVSGYKTVRSSELQAMLAKARQKADENEAT